MFFLKHFSKPLECWHEQKQKAIRCISECIGGLMCKLTRNQSELLIKLNCIHIDPKLFEEKWEDQFKLWTWWKRPYWSFLNSKIMETRYFNQKIQQKKLAIQIYCALIENSFLLWNNVLRIEFSTLKIIDIMLTWSLNNHNYYFCPFYLEAGKPHNNLRFIIQNVIDLSWCISQTNCYFCN